MMYGGGEEDYAPGQLVVVQQNGYGASISRDYGNTWEKLPVSSDYFSLMAISKGGKFIALGGLFQGVKFSEDYGRTFRTFSDFVCSHVRMSPDGKHLVTWSNNDKVVIYLGVENGERRRMSFPGGYVRGCFFYEGGHILVSTSDGYVTLTSDYLRVRGTRKKFSFTLDVLAGYDTVNASGFYGFRNVGGAVGVNYAESGSMSDAGKSLRYFTYSTDAFTGESSLDGSAMLITRNRRHPWLFTNNGWTYEELKSLPTGNYETNADVSHNGSAMVYSKGTEIYMSRDRGRNFSKLSALPSPNGISCIGISK